MMSDENVVEYISLDNNLDNYFFNSRDRNLALIDLYKKFKSRVGTVEMRSNKKLWEVVAKELVTIFKVPVTATKCENRWKVLERNYKKCVDNNNRTGRGVRIFEFEKEFDEIYGKKKNIRPILLLSSATVNNPQDVAAAPSAEEPVPGTSHQDSQEDTICPPCLPSTSRDKENTGAATARATSKIVRKRSLRTTTSSYKKRNDILVEMKNDLKSYYESKKKIDLEKLEIAKKKLEDRTKRTELLERYLKIQTSVITFQE
ncbi:uncharacterized protein LOC123307649 [Coccinella septempunctata]|uniref:uncharacterized protein LOC123307649 n=1 Tax=Coccinella septempunctata TaxID=41139 RepID=UPI001D090B42|nr:uncharacterized protein LOC123307649 [Coccinella septempunctata]